MFHVFSIALHVSLSSMSDVLSCITELYGIYSFVVYLSRVFANVCYIVVAFLVTLSSVLEIFNYKVFSNYFTIISAHSRLSQYPRFFPRVFSTPFGPTAPISVCGLRTFYAFVHPFMQAWIAKDYHWFFCLGNSR